MNNEKTQKNTNSQQRWLIVGGGFRGIIAAWELVNRGMQVSLIETSSRMGGILNSIPWNGCELDFGCHLFANSDRTTTERLLELMDYEVFPVTLNVSSVMNGQRLDGVEMPHLAAFGEETVRKILHELVQAVKHPKPDLASQPSLWHALEALYGPTAAELLDSTVRKTWAGISTRELASQSFHAGQFRRIRFLDDAEADVLKQLPEFDDRVVSSSAGNPLRFLGNEADVFAHRCFYPSSGGVGGFTTRAVKKLLAAGVEILSEQAIERIEVNADTVTVIGPDGRQIQGQQLLWAADAASLASTLNVTTGLKDQVHKVPMVLAHFLIDAEQQTGVSYFHDFDEGTLVYRGSAPVLYGGQAPKGHAYLCAEVPTTIGSDVWNNPEDYLPQIWSELVAAELVTERPAMDSRVMKTPVSYKVPKCGFERELEPLQAFLDNHSRLHLLNEWLFAKHLLVQHVMAVIDEIQGVKSESCRAA